MTTWRAAARFSCAATDLLFANTKRASQRTSRLVLAPAISHSGPSGLLSQQAALQQHFVRVGNLAPESFLKVCTAVRPLFLILQGFAANTGSGAGSIPPPPPVAPIEDTDAEDTNAEEYNFSDSEAEDFQPDTEDFEAADSGADEPESDQLEAVESGAEGPIATGQLQVPTIEGVSQEEQDALLQQIQSSSKKQQRYARTAGGHGKPVTVWLPGHASTQRLLVPSCTMSSTRWQCDLPCPSLFANTLTA